MRQAPNVCSGALAELIDCCRGNVVSTKQKNRPMLEQKQLEMIAKIREAGLINQQVAQKRDDLPRPDSSLLFQTKEERIKKLLRS